MNLVATIQSCSRPSLPEFQLVQVVDFDNLEPLDDGIEDEPDAVFIQVENQIDRERIRFAVQHLDALYHAALALQNFHRLRGVGLWMH